MVYNTIMYYIGKQSTCNQSLFCVYVRIRKETYAHPITLNRVFKLCTSVHLIRREYNLFFVNILAYFEGRLGRF